MKDLRFLVIGAGSRGNAYARAVTGATTGSIYAVAEPDDYKRRVFGQRYIWGDDTPKEGQEFSDWKVWLEYEKQRRTLSSSSTVEDGGDDAKSRGIDGLFICTLDESHIDILIALSESNLQDIHVMCEKPLALSLADCASVYAMRKHAPSIFSIGHVMRYTPHNRLLRRLLHEQEAIGEIISIEHTEPVGYWHFAHSYVRGNWRRATPNGDGSLLTKSGHDLDFILWLLNDPDLADSDSGQAPGGLRTVSSSGRIAQFHRSRKPAAAGNATNCLSCPFERRCIYSAVRIYRDQHLAKGKRGWPVKIVCPDIEDFAATPAEAEKHLLARLREDYDSSTNPEEISSRAWYGRCVWESDNDVCDDQVVTLTWDDPYVPSPRGNIGGKTAVVHMTAHTEEKCDRRGRIYGTLGEITYDSKSVSWHWFPTRETTLLEPPKMSEEEEKAHGGGDYGLAKAFVSAVDAVVNRGWAVSKAQREFVGCSLEDIIQSHAVVFAAEEARRDEKIIQWKVWWAQAIQE